MTIQIRSAAEMAEVLPLMAGVQMTDSLCIAFIPRAGGVGRLPIARLPLVPADDLPAAADIHLAPASMLDKGPLSAAIVAYVDTMPVGPVLAMVRESLALDGIDLVTAHSVTDGMMTDLLDPGAPAREVTVHCPAAVDLRLSGCTPPPTEEALRDRVRPSGDLSETTRRWSPLAEKWDPEMGLRAVGDLLNAETPVDDLPGATLALAAMTLCATDSRHGPEVRDAVLWRITPGKDSDIYRPHRLVNEVQDLITVPWTNYDASPARRSVLRIMDALALTPDQWAPDLAATGALLAWWTGLSIHARVLTERGLAVDPDHTLTGLIDGLLQFGVAPR